MNVPLHEFFRENSSDSTQENSLDKPTDEIERDFLNLVREAKTLGIAEDVAIYAKFLIKEKKQKTFIPYEELEVVSK